MFMKQVFHDPGKLNWLNPGLTQEKTMATSLAEIRARLLEQENKMSGNRTQGTGDNAIFAFWNQPENSTTTLRFLPDGDEQIGRAHV